MLLKSRSIPRTSMLSRPPFPIGARGIGRAIQLRPLPLMCEHRKSVSTVIEPLLTD